jgi:4-amino-4-deoxy-L-arabinose transferase-like glycosyltransferase
VTTATGTRDRSVVVGSPRARRRPGELAVVAAITVAGALLRLHPIRSVWLDEAISVAQARLPFGAMLHQLMYDDLHPPLWGVLLWLDVRLLGDGPVALRIPSLLVGIACIPLTHLLARELFDRRTGIAAAAFTAAAPLAVWYSGEARMYALYLFWSILALLGQAMVLRRGGWRGWAVFVLGSAGMFYTHYFAVLQLVAQHLVFLALAVRRRPLLRPWLLAIGATVVALLPLAPYLIEQLGHAGSPGAAPTTDNGRPVSLYVVMANLVWGVWGYHPDAVMTALVALWPILLLLVLALLGKGRSWPATLLVAAVAVPIAGAFLISMKARTFFEVRYFLSVLPPLLVLGARAATGWLSGTVARAVAVGALILTLLAGLADQQLNPANPRVYDYRSAFQYVEAQAQPDDLILYAPAYLDYVLDYYRPAANADPLLPNVPLPRHRGRIVLLASFLDQPGTAAEVGQALATLQGGGRTVQVTKSWENVTLWILN